MNFTKRLLHGENARKQFHDFLLKQESCQLDSTPNKQNELRRE